ncbi:hypothetical protein NSE01_17760 [Novosphingobium sediminis]|uniref:Uncharacterized protein n=1 Tax=Novosphingobium sediminis TaxID=707214 RepID=A0A512AJT4_9SPHN|nr:hypothetical protein NSE01_17760 [Novosphingobium sediminis]
MRRGWDGGEWTFQLFVFVIPAKAGIQFQRFSLNLLIVPERQAALDSRLRGNDEGQGMYWWEADVDDEVPLTARRLCQADAGNTFNHGAVATARTSAASACF